MSEVVTLVVYEMYDKIRNHIWEAVGGKVSGSVEKQIRDRVLHQLHDITCLRIRDEIVDQIKYRKISK